MMKQPTNQPTNQPDKTVSSTNFMKGVQFVQQMNMPRLMRQDSKQNKMSMEASIDIDVIYSKGRKECVLWSRPQYKAAELSRVYSTSRHI
jgi:hypothetical protein